MTRVPQFINQRNDAMKMSFSLVVILVFYCYWMIARSFDGCGMSVPVIKVAHKEKEWSGSPPTSIPLFLLSYWWSSILPVVFWGCLKHLSQNIVNVARSPPFSWFGGRFDNRLIQ